MRPTLRIGLYGLVLVGVVALASVGYVNREHWWPWSQLAEEAEHDHDHDHEEAAPGTRVLLTDQALRNLAPNSAPLKPGVTWRTIEVPGMIVDRPGYSDRSIPAPAGGIVTAIRRLPGETVKPGEPLFTLRLVSEPLHQAQAELYKSVQEMQLARARRTRFEASGGSVPRERIIEVEEQIARLDVAARAHRQELATRGLTPEQMDGVEQGRFVTEITVPAPADRNGHGTLPAFEMQELKVELGHQVEAGQTLAVLSDHRLLTIEGRAFREETPLLEQSVRMGWPVTVDFLEGATADRDAAVAVTGTMAVASPIWVVAQLEASEAAGHLPPLQRFQISHLANYIDPENRTFAFLLPLENQARLVEHDGQRQVLWRFRPGQKVRLHIRVERLENVIELPPEAVARDGGESYVFVQNVNTFERVPVRVLLRERTRVVIADDGEFPPGVYVARQAAAQLNRMVKSQSGSVPKGYHVHADGSLHRNDEED